MENDKPMFTPTLYKDYLMPSKFRILLAPTIDIVLFIGILFCLMVFYILPMENFDDSLAYSIAIVYVIVQLLIHLTFLKFGYASFGHFILGLIHVSGLSGRRLYRPDFIDLWFESIRYSFKYQDIYEIFFFFTSEYNQSIVFEDNNIYIVKYRAYKKMISNKQLFIYDH